MSSITHLIRWTCITLAVLLLLSHPLSRAYATTPAASGAANAAPVDVAARFAHLRHGINLSHWFAQSGDYSPKHLETHTTAGDFALIKQMGFDHVRFTLEPAPLMDEANPEKLKQDYLQYVDKALNQMLAQNLAVIVDIHPSDEFKLQLKDNHRVEAFAGFWRALAAHLATRDPERVFFETINEPMVEDSYRWYGIQAKLVAAIRASAPRHTIIVSGHRWSGMAELLPMEPYADSNLIYNYHYYDPFVFTHQGATWAGDFLPKYKNVPYPSSPEAVSGLLEAITDVPARDNLQRYGKEQWNAARVEADAARAAAWAKKYNVHLTCNEFGVYRQFAPAADRAVWVHDMRTALEKYNIGWTMWDYAGGFGVVTKKDGHATPDAALVQALGLTGINR